MTNYPVTEPEILLINKMQELDTFLPEAHWNQLRDEAEQAALPCKNESEIIRHRRKVYLSDFVQKAISLPVEVVPDTSVDVLKQMYRLHLFCCQRAIHDPEVKRNPFVLHFKALMEMKEALIGIMLTYRLINPSVSYRWSYEYLSNAIVVDTAKDGHAKIAMTFAKPEQILEAVTENIVTDWLIYRAYDNNGIRTLMDIKNNLLTLPDYKRGGTPAAEFSRFERKFQEQRNRIENHKNQELDLEFRKTLVHNIAEQTAKQLLNSGVSNLELLQQAFNGDLSGLLGTAQKAPEEKPAPQPSSVPQIENKKKSKAVSDDYSVDNLLEKFGK